MVQSELINHASRNPSAWTMALMMLLGCSMLRTTATTKVMNFTSNFVALIFFLSVGQIRLRRG